MTDADEERAKYIAWANRHLQKTHEARKPHQEEMREAMLSGDPRKVLQILIARWERLPQERKEEMRPRLVIYNDRVLLRDALRLLMTGAWLEKSEMDQEGNLIRHIRADAPEEEVVMGMVDLVEPLWREMLDRVMAEGGTQ